MKEFNYNLPPQSIAKYPPKVRGSSNLLVLDRNSGDMYDRKYFDIPKYIKKGDIVVLNETKVLSSRTYFNTPRDKKVEVLFLEERNEVQWYCLIGRAKNVKIGETLTCNEFMINILKREGNGFVVKFLQGKPQELFNRYGHTPLPPYMKREDVSSDRERYNTVFSSAPGAVAAPTASLNLTNGILEDIEKRGAKTVKIELKVGWGTFAPIREEDFREHEIHSEYMNISENVAKEINECKGRVWAFGTTVARALESAYSQKEKKVLPYSGETQLYIYPGYTWRVVDILVTNFHMPDSSLILLVSSFAGKENILKAYDKAIKEGYKFLSYGDSMLIGDNLKEN
jgi:S-adenosylmethionine:tRNA ribosyltransferase-isomerase